MPILGIWDYIKIGAVAILLGVCGYYVYNYHHMATVIAQQKDKIGGLELGQKDIQEKQKKYDAFMDTVTKTKGRVADAKQKITEQVNTVPDADLDGLYDQFRLRPDNKVRPATPGGKRRP